MRWRRTKGSRTSRRASVGRWSRRGWRDRIEIETQAGRGDHLDVEIGEISGGGADAVEPVADDVEGVLGGIEEDASRLGYTEAAQARGAGGDRNGEIEGEEGFAAFGLAADDTDSLLGPQCGDEPSLFLGALGKTFSIVRSTIAAKSEAVSG